MSYSIEAAAAEICGDSVKHPVEWVMRRIRTGQIRAYKVGHTWRMRREDIDDAIAALYNGTGLDNVYTGQLDGSNVPPVLTAGSLGRRRTT
jgi:excisionase family DNA binding protein